MKTLVIISHPDILESSSQQFLLNAAPETDDFTMHHLDAAYPDGHIDVAREQTLLNQHDRILFPSPCSSIFLSTISFHFFEELLSDYFFYRNNGTACGLK